MPHPFFDRTRPGPWIIGHRGSAGTHPENTLAAFAAGLEDGANVLETDLHVSREGVPVLLHDPEVDRVTHGIGLAADFDWSDLRVLDAGYHFLDPEGQAPFRGLGHRIPSLEEAFQAFPDARFNIEIKCEGIPAIETTLELIERFDRNERTLLAAGDNDIMADLRRVLDGRAEGPAVSASLAEIVGSIGSAIEGTTMPAGVMALQIPPDFGDSPLVTPELVDHAHSQGVEVHVWTINDLSEIERLLETGVDGIVTDYPGRMAEWLRQKG
jgi:glycerophosphoryl diester phosphodiesterase